MRVLVTGAAGFIGFHLCGRLIANGHYVIGLDNLNEYYDVQLKIDRLKQLGVNPSDAIIENKITKSESYSNFSFIKLDLIKEKDLNDLFEGQNFNVVCNLAAQAGVRYSLKNPKAYVNSNMVGFAILLECCKSYQIEHLVYASSSSVYGNSKLVPFSTSHNVDHPISLYAATKKSNELFAHTYSSLFGLRTTGLRFFTVYGPWGRPDMAMFLFTDAIIKKEPIKVFNNGDLARDFTYISDIVEGIVRIIENNSPDHDKNYLLYNIGRNEPVQLMDFISAIENELGERAEKQMLPMQPGDVSQTWADIEDLKRDYGYEPKVSVKEGVANFIKWYMEYYIKGSEDK